MNIGLKRFTNLINNLVNNSYKTIFVEKKSKSESIMVAQIHKSNITGVLLAGGKSSRMQRNKTLLQINGKTIIEHLFEMMNNVFDEVVISTNNPEEYDFIDAIKYTDIYKYYGPLAGLHSVFTNSGSQKIFLVSADMAFLRSDVIRHILSLNSYEYIIAPRVGEQIHLLCGLYDRQILPVLQNILMSVSEAKQRNEIVKNSALSLWNFADRIGVETIDVTFERYYFNDLFFSVNTQEDYEYANSKLFY